MRYACFADKGPLPITPLGCAKVAHVWNIQDDVRCAKVIYGSATSAVSRLTEQLDNEEFIKQYTRYSKTFGRKLGQVVTLLNEKT